MKEYEYQCDVRKAAGGPAAACGTVTGGGAEVTGREIHG